jgi:hypothetical protein
MSTDWYDKYVESGLRDIVRLLRDNGFNTTYSCHHAMVVEMESYKIEDVAELYDLLVGHGYDGFTAEMALYKQEGQMLKQSMRLQFHKCPAGCKAGSLENHLAGLRSP